MGWLPAGGLEISCLHVGKKVVNRWRARQSISRVDIIDVQYAFIIQYSICSPGSKLIYVRRSIMYHSLSCSLPQPHKAGMANIYKLCVANNKYSPEEWQLVLPYFCPFFCLRMHLTLNIPAQVPHTHTHTHTDCSILNL